MVVRLLETKMIYVLLRAIVSTTAKEDNRRFSFFLSVLQLVSPRARKIAESSRPAQVLSRYPPRAVGYI